MGALLSAVEKVTYLINRCRIYELLYLRQKSHEPKDSPGALALENLEQALMALYATILILLSKAGSLYEKSSLARTIYGFLNPKEVATFLQQCQSLEKRVEFEAENCERTYGRKLQTDATGMIQKLSQKLIDLESPILRIDSRVIRLYQTMEDSERLHILNWISSIPYEVHHYFARKGWTQGTGQWLLDHSQYREWRDSSASVILWLHGPRKFWHAKQVPKLTVHLAGAGKTKLVSTVIDTLIEKNRKSPNDEMLAYFYCDRNQTDRQHPAQIMNSFVRQLSVIQSTHLIQSSTIQLYDLKKKSGFSSGGLKFEESKDIIANLLQASPQTTLIIDAMDECEVETRSDFIKTMYELVAGSIRPVKVFISSRPDDDIRYYFKESKSPSLEITATDNRGDIASFVNDKIINSPPHWREKVSPGLRNSIREVLVKESDGM